MAEKVTRYTAEFKQTIVNLYHSGKSYSQIHNEYGISSSALSNWVGSMSIKKTSKKSKERFFGLVWSEPLVMGMRAEGIVIAVNVVKNG